MTIKDLNEAISAEPPPQRITKKVRRRGTVSFKAIFSFALFLILLGAISSFLYDPPDYRWLLVFGFLSAFFAMSALIIKVVERE